MSGPVAYCRSRVFPSIWVVSEGGAYCPALPDRSRFLQQKTQNTQFIGVFGNPANKIAGRDSGESIAMTAPVMTGSPSLDTGESRKELYSSCCSCLPAAANRWRIL